jgi:O-antigen ligase
VGEAAKINIVPSIKQRLKQHQEDLLLLATGVIFSCFLLTTITTEKYSFLVVPFLILFLPLLATSVKVFYICFFGSFFFDYNVYVSTHHFSLIFVSLQDILCLMLVAAYCGRFLVHNAGSHHGHMDSAREVTAPTAKYLWLLLGISALSTLTNLYFFSLFDIFRSFSYLFHLLELVVIFSLMGKTVKNLGRNLFIWIVIAFAGIEMLVVAYQYIQTLLQGSYYFRDVKGLFMHHSQVGNVMTVALAAALYKMMISRSLKLKLLFLLLSLLFGWSIVCSGSRGTMTGLAVAVTVFLLPRIKFNSRFIFSTLGVGVFLLLLLVLSPAEHLRRFTFNSSAGGVDMSSYQRFFIWRGAWDHFLHAPLAEKLFGIGIGNFSGLQYNYVLETGQKAISGAHNIFLHVLSETGILGLAVFVGIFASVIATLRKKGKKDSFAYLYMLATITLLVSGLFQETFWFQIVFGNFWLLFLLGYAFALSEQNDSPPEPVRPFTAPSR